MSRLTNSVSIYNPGKPLLRDDSDPRMHHRFATLSVNSRSVPNLDACEAESSFSPGSSHPSILH